MALSERAVAFVGFVVAVIGPVVGVAEEERAAAVALAVVDFVRPSVGEIGLHAVREALAKLHGERVVVAVDAVLGLVDAAITLVRTRAQVDRRGVRFAGGIAAGVADLVSEGRA